MIRGDTSSFNNKEQDWIAFKLKKEEKLNDIKNKKEIFVEVEHDSADGKIIKSEWLKIYKVYDKFVVAFNGTFKESYDLFDILKSR